MMSYELQVEMLGYIFSLLTSILRDLVLAQIFTFNAICNPTMIDAYPFTEVWKF